MSRTDKTRPFWVRVKDYPSNYFECHNHANGVCDLENDSDVRHWCSGSWHDYCHYAATMTFICSGEGAACNCQTEICSGQYDRKLRNRRARYAVRKDIEDRLREW